MQQLEGNVLYPMVVGPRMRLHPAVVLVLVTLGGALAGVAGAFLAVPIAIGCAVALAQRREREEHDPALTVPSAAGGAGLSPGRSWVGIRDGATEDRSRSLKPDERRSVVLGIPTLAVALAVTVVTTYRPVATSEFVGSTLVIGLIIGIEGLLAM